MRLFSSHKLGFSPGGKAEGGGGEINNEWSYSLRIRLHGEDRKKTFHIKKKPDALFALQ